MPDNPAPIALREQAGVGPGSSTLHEKHIEPSIKEQFDQQLEIFKQGFLLWHASLGRNFSYKLRAPSPSEKPLFNHHQPCVFSTSTAVNPRNQAVEAYLRAIPPPRGVISHKQRTAYTQQRLQAAAFGLDARFLHHEKNRRLILNIHKARYEPSLQADWARILKNQADKPHLAQALALWERFLGQVPPGNTSELVRRGPFEPRHPAWQKAYADHRLGGKHLLTHDDLRYLAKATVHDANYLLHRQALNIPPATPLLSAEHLSAGPQQALAAGWIAKLQQEMQFCGEHPGSYRLYEGQPNVLREGRLFSYGRLPQDLARHESKSHYLALEVGKDTTAQAQTEGVVPKRIEVYTFDEKHTHRDKTVAGKIASGQALPVSGVISCGPETPTLFLEVNARGELSPMRAHIAQPPHAKGAAHAVQRSQGALARGLNFGR